MRLGLIPVGYRRVVVAAFVGVTVLDGYPYGLSERHRVFNVEPVVANLTAPILAAFLRDPVVRCRVLLLGVQAVLK